MKHTVIIGEGCNSDEAIIMVAESVEQAVAFCEKLPFAKPVTKDGEVIPLKYNLEEIEEVETLFTSYYGGCGGCYALRIEEVETLSPSIQWDRD
jgi:hypothetical protein